MKYLTKALSQHLQQNIVGMYNGLNYDLHSKTMCGQIAHRQKRSLVSQLRMQGQLIGAHITPLQGGDLTGKIVRLIPRDMTYTVKSAYSSSVCSGLSKPFLRIGRELSNAKQINEKHWSRIWVFNRDVT